MSNENYSPVKKTAMPVVAGILNIVIGSLCLLGVIVAAIVAAAAVPFIGDLGFASGVFVALIAIPLLILGVLSVVGGIYSLQRRMWGWALTGSIASVLVSNVLGIVAIVLTAISRNEFSQ